MKTTYNVKEFTYNVEEFITTEITILVSLLHQIAGFLYYYGAFFAHSCLISPPQWLIDMRKCPTISPDDLTFETPFMTK